jgi:speckle-type POZ protein
VATTTNSEGGASYENSAKPWPRLPQKVQASFADSMKEMVSTGQGTWAAVSWPYRDTIYDPYRFYTCHTRRFANFRLIVEFKQHTSFVEGERQVLTHLSKLLDTQSMSDVTFVVKNERIGAHTAIVVSASPVICAMLEEDKFKEGRTKVVEVDDMKPAVFKEMLRYLYTGRAPKLDEDEMIEPLFLAADKYQIESLKNCCEQRLIKKLNVKTVVHYLVLSHLHSALQLLEASLMLMEIHKNEVKACPEWKELMKNYPDLFFLAANRMIR